MAHDTCNILDLPGLITLLLVAVAMGTNTVVWSPNLEHLETCTRLQRLRSIYLRSKVRLFALAHCWIITGILHEYT